jgi:phospholipase C
MSLVYVALLVLILNTVVHMDCQTAPNTFDRIMIINFENQPNFLTMFYPYFKELANSKGTHLTEYHGVTHPSQPNYISQIAGDYFGLHWDSPHDYNYTMVADLMERKGLNWKAYQENYPGNSSHCFTDANSPDKKYYRKHNPFMSFISVSKNVTRCTKHVVNADQLYVDIERNDLPALIYYTPNIDNDGHNTGLSFANDYLAKFLPPLLENRRFMNGTLIVVTFDEDDYLFFNRIYCVVLGPMVQPGGKDETTYNHYSLLRTIEDNFQLGTLGRHDKEVNSFKCLNKAKKYIH